MSPTQKSLEEARALYGPIFLVSEYNVAVRRIALALDAARQSEWQDISTAPKDGTNVLLVNRRGLMATGLWMDGPLGSGWFLRGGNHPDTFFNEHHGPTHWQSLPAPPSRPQP